MEKVGTTEATEQFFDTCTQQIMKQMVSVLVSLMLKDEPDASFLDVRSRVTESMSFFAGFDVLPDLLIAYNNEKNKITASQERKQHQVDGEAK